MDPLRALTRRSETRTSLTFQDWLDLMISPFGFNLSTTIRGDREEIGNNFPGYVAGAYKSSGVVFAIERIRMAVFSEASFMWRQRRSGRPGDLFSTAALELLRHPWHGGTSGDLLARAILDADLAGNHYAVRLEDSIKRLRPDWVSIVIGSDNAELDPSEDPNAEIIGYAYHPGGKNSQSPVITYEADQIAHFAPIPDPLANYRGMSWLTPVLRDIEADKATTVHKSQFFENGATPNMILTHPPMDEERFRKTINLFRETHEGATNAYKTLHLVSGTDANVVGKDFQQLEFAATQGKGETRIANASGIHPTLLGLSEGMAGSSLNAGNYAAARRSTVDTVFRPLWRDLCGSYETIMPPPAMAELWVDLRDVAFLREDQKDAAQIEQIKAQSIRQLIDGGFDPASVVAAVTSGDMRLLTHTGMLSVQLQTPGETQLPEEEPDV